VALEIMHEEARRGWWDTALLDEFERFITSSAPLVQVAKAS